MNGIYCLTFPNGKRYVGIGMGKEGINGRWRKYKSLRCKSQKKLYNALKLYGVDKVKFEVILETNDDANALRSEMYLIDVWNLQDDRYGYNITAGGEGSNGWYATPEISKKMSNAHIGLKHSQETKDKISNSHKGKKKSFEHIQKLKLIQRTQETKDKLRIAQTGKKLSQETKDKMSISQLKRRINERKEDTHE